MTTSTVKREFPYSWHRTGWEGQLGRVSRWFDRLMHVDGPADAEDFLYAYFQNCYHLRDWLPEDSFPKALVDNFFEAHLEMRICRDVANLTKHFALTLPPAQGFEPAIVRDYVGPGRGWFEDDSRLAIVTNDGRDGLVLDARDIAHGCLALWCQFLPDCAVTTSISLHFAIPRRRDSRVADE